MAVIGCADYIHGQRLLPSRVLRSHNRHSARVATVLLPHGPAGTVGHSHTAYRSRLSPHVIHVQASHHPAVHAASCLRARVSVGVSPSSHASPSPTRPTR